MTTTQLRRRLLLALTVSSAPGCGGLWDNPCGGWDSTFEESAYVSGELADAEATCPDDAWSEEVTWASPVPSCSSLSDSGIPGDDEMHRASVLLGQVEAECRYEIHCEGVIACPGGRPIEQDGQPVLSPSQPRGDWASLRRPSVEGLDAQERQALAERWTRAGLEEHSSVAGFNKLALDLLALGAPPQLLMAAQQAAIEEIRHAQDAFALASTYAGHPVGPGPLPLAPITPARDLVELALSTAREGAINETLSAWDAQQRLEASSDPEVRAALAAVVDEETRHAELAWRILAWCVAEGGDEVRAALHALFASLARTEGPLRPCIDEVLLPVAAQLLGLRRAA
jgi:hypothetical protein